MVVREVILIDTTDTDDISHNTITSIFHDQIIRHRDIISDFRPMDMSPVQLELGKDSRTIQLLQCKQHRSFLLRRLHVSLHRHRQAHRLMIREQKHCSIVLDGSHAVCW